MITIHGIPIYRAVASFTQSEPPRYNRQIVVNGSLLKHFAPRMIPAPFNDNNEKVA